MRTTKTTIQHTWTCERCGATETQETAGRPEGWNTLDWSDGIPSEGATYRPRDICPGCTKSFRDWLKGDLHGIEVGLHLFGCTCNMSGKEHCPLHFEVCTCPKVKPNDPTKISSVSMGWTHKPCPVPGHRPTVTF